ncbi:hypothetical protein BN961_00522 [Afipia felis]|uniref:Uncharacterized protein n=1 Tax=Afipia felis TaxID=1035 RepID=A0A090MHX8_AFIFE|nr:hypothetical protein BN961_00522 [Afipia felis]
MQRYVGDAGVSGDQPEQAEPRLKLVGAERRVVIRVALQGDAVENNPRGRK